MKKIFGSWFFWAMLICVVIATFAIINGIKEREKTDKAFQGLVNGTQDYVDEINNADSYLDKFTYNYEDREIEYNEIKPTFQTYEKIENGMKESEVINLLGYGKKSEGVNTYTLTWGDEKLSKGYVVQVFFDKSNNEVISKIQIGLN